MQDNMTILSKAWLEGTTDFQQRIPNPTQAGLAATTAALFDPMNGDLWNQFNGQLNNTIGYSIISALRWDNPYNTFRLANLRWGNSIREIMPKWLKTHVFSDTSKQLMDVFKPDFEQWFYSINYETKIPWDLNRAELLRAMSAPDGSTAINDLYLAVATAALNTDDLNIAETCTNCISEADTRWNGGLFRHSVPVTGNAQADARALLEAIRQYMYLLPWPSQNFNHVDVPVFANTGLNGRDNEMVLFISAAEMASLDVNAYAELFNISRAEVMARIMVLPELPIEGARAILTTDTFIHWHDSVYGIFNFFNIDTLNDKQILHHQAIVAPNPSVPVIVFTKEAGTTVQVIKMEASSLAIEAAADTIYPGGTLDLNPRLIGTVTANTDGIEVKPDACLWDVMVSAGEVNTRTYVDKFGVLHLQKTGIEPGATVTVMATSIYTANGTQTPLTATKKITVIAPPETEPDMFTVSYSVTPDGTYGIPGDTVQPADVYVVKGSDVTIAPALATSWTTADGKETGTPGAWTFVGWGSTNAGTPALTEITAIEEDTTAYGVWSFQAS